MVCSLLYARLLGPDSEFLELPVGHGSHQESSDWNRTDGQSYKMYSKCKCADKSDENPQTEADLNAMGGCLFTYSGEDASFSHTAAGSDRRKPVSGVGLKKVRCFLHLMVSVLPWMGQRKSSSFRFNSAHAEQKSEMFPPKQQMYCLLSLICVFGSYSWGQRQTTSTNWRYCKASAW